MRALHQLAVVCGNDLREDLLSIIKSSYVVGGVPVYRGGPHVLIPLAPVTLTFILGFEIKVKIRAVKIVLLIGIRVSVTCPQFPFT